MSMDGSRPGSSRPGSSRFPGSSRLPGSRRLPSSSRLGSSAGERYRSWRSSRRRWFRSGESLGSLLQARQGARRAAKRQLKPDLRPRRAPKELRPRPRVRLRVAGVLVVVAFISLFVRLWYLQVLEAPHYRQSVLANVLRTVQTTPVRGEILARDGQVLVGNVPSETVAVTRLAADANPNLVGRLATLLGVSPASIRATLTDSVFSDYEPIPVATGVTTSQVFYLEEHPSQFQGVTVETTPETTYPYGSTAAQELGYVGEISPSELKAMKGQGYQPGDLVGQAGVEGSFQSYLRGTPGKEQLEVNSLGAVVGTLSHKPSKPGDNVELSLDLPLEQFAANALSKEIHILRHTYDPVNHIYPAAPGGAVVVENPNNGHILAMVSYPSYNPSVWVGGISEANYQALTAPSAHDPMVNRAIQGAYTPGSTFKIATSTAALDDGLITPTTTIDDTGLFTVPNCTGKCTFHNAGYAALGPIQFPLALAASDDVFFYTLGFRFWINRAKYGLTPIQNMANRYSFGELTGIDLPGEVTGQVDSPQLRALQHKENPTAFPNPGWYVGDNLEMAFGQGETLLTPIQLATAYSTFANGGTRYQPQVAEAVVSPSGKVVKRFAPKVVGHVPLPPSTYDAMLTGFEQEVLNPLGTGYYTFLGYPYSQFPIAGKTGSASLGPGKEPNSLYVGFGPVPHPKYVVAAIIEQGGYGDVGAGPVARKIFEYLMSHPVGPSRLPGRKGAGG